MKIVYTGQQYGTFGSLIERETRIAVDLLKDKFRVNHWRDSTILEISIDKRNCVRFKADTVVISMMNEDDNIILEERYKNDSIQQK